MKKLFSFLLLLVVSTSLFAQKQKQKNNKPQNKKEEARNVVLGNPQNKGHKDVDVIWDGTKGQDAGNAKASKNQPAKVRSAFASDYPNASNVTWSKYRGDWTATFNNGLNRSVAVYHANGQRKDTRTVIQQPQLPKTVIDEVLRKRPTTRISDIVKIEAAKAAKNIFRIKTVDGSTSRFVFYDTNGKEVNYDY